MSREPARVAVVGGGCAAMAAAFELTRPEHRGRFEVTVHQLGWRLGGKGASGRGPADRIEEHGLHLWMGYYENAFRLMRECYAELGRDPGSCPLASWRDAFFPDSVVGLADRRPDGTWTHWLGHFPPGRGEPGDPFDDESPFTVRRYMARTGELVVSLLASVADRHGGVEADAWKAPRTVDEAVAAVRRVLRYGGLAGLTALLQGSRLLADLLRLLPAPGTELVLALLDLVDRAARAQLEALGRSDDEVRRIAEVLDLVLASLRGCLRHGLATDPRGFDAIDHYETREWLRLHGAAESTLESAFVRGLYDLGFAFEDGDPERPAIGAGVGMRGAVRMFYTYRGALFWKMRGGMGDVVFAPLYEVLRRRGVRFEFFHRLENVRLAPAESLAPGERPYVEALELDVQAGVRDGEYRPLVDVKGVPSWPAAPDWDQLVDGERLRAEDRRFESHWDRRREDRITLEVTRDFDFVVLGVSLGAIPHVCGELVESDPRWRTMVETVRTVATQAFQLWSREELEELGWHRPSVNLSSFVTPFDTWADMPQLIPLESWDPEPRAIGYFCSALPTPDDEDVDAPTYPRSKRDEVRANAVRFLERDLRELWPGAVDETGRFRWEILADAADPRAEPVPEAGAERFESQFWTANVNPTDRYVLSVPGSQAHRISPLDNTYDNLTIAGDWTDCGHNIGCVESAVMSGRLAAHALSGSPRLEDIPGFDHP
ncbi:MAG: NAD(P)-binding protein [Thermoanaerobaculia bacterium]